MLPCVAEFCTTKIVYIVMLFCGVFFISSSLCQDHISCTFKKRWETYSQNLQFSIRKKFSKHVESFFLTWKEQTSVSEDEMKEWDYLTWKKYMLSSFKYVDKVKCKIPKIITKEYRYFLAIYRFLCFCHLIIYLWFWNLMHLQLSWEGYELIPL